MIQDAGWVEAGIGCRSLIRTIFVSALRPLARTAVITGYSATFWRERSEMIAKGTVRRQPGGPSDGLSPGRALEEHRGWLLERVVGSQGQPARRDGLSRLGLARVSAVRDFETPCGLMSADARGAAHGRGGVSRIVRTTAAKARYARTAIGECTLVSKESISITYSREKMTARDGCPRHTTFGRFYVIRQRVEMRTQRYCYTLGPEAQLEKIKI